MKEIMWRKALSEVSFADRCDAEREETHKKGELRGSLSPRYLER
jgi:hypothetical protein